MRFFRQRSRVIGALVPPVIFWFLIGSGLGASFRHVQNPDGIQGLNYLQYFFPGTVVMIVLFAAVFSTISIIDDRKEGFLQSVLVAPVSRLSIVLGKIMGGTVIAFVQGLAFVLIAPVLGIHMSFWAMIFVVLILFAVSFGLTGLGFIIAWRMDSTQGFHSVMNLFLLPMWFLSGALFPLEGAPRWLQIAMTLDPLTYSVAGLRHGFYGAELGAVRQFPDPSTCLWVTLIFCILTFGVSVVTCGRRQS